MKLDVVENSNSEPEFVKLYVIYDSVAQESGPIFHAKNDAVAQRNFLNMLSSENVMNRKDYSLVNVGSYDPQRMTIYPYDHPVTISEYGDIEAVNE